MRLMFVYHLGDETGSAQDMIGYTQGARALGHEVVVYGPSDAGYLYSCSPDVDSAEAIIFVLEWNLHLHHGSRFNLVRLLSRFPRERRVVIDCDGMYDDVVRVAGDSNHPDATASQLRCELYESLSEKLYQPTLHPLRRNVRPFLFHAYNPNWEAPLEFHHKEYGMFYVGNNWFRWQALQRVLQAIEPIRELVGRIGLVGYGWDPPAYWVEPQLREVACFTDPVYLRRLRVEVMPPVPVTQVVSTMSKAVFNPVLVRPLFNQRRLVTCRTFETPAANTIPLFDLDDEYVREIYGDPALELMLRREASEQIADVLHRPEHYARVVQAIRRHLAEKHSYAARLRELVDIVNE